MTASRRATHDGAARWITALGGRSTGCLHLTGVAATLREGGTAAQRECHRTSDEQNNFRHCCHNGCLYLFPISCTESACRDLASRSLGADYAKNGCLPQFRGYCARTFAASIECSCNCEDVRSRGKACLRVPKAGRGRHLFLSEHCASNLPPGKANREWLLASLANIGITFDMAKISGIGQ